MFVIGTAGHVDHGKSSLVKALTGIDPDRLPEEKEREMTIDLGFAWLSLPDGKEVGIVDVPGHERFVRNMIAGVGGIDAVLFVIAADDGWMPQSQEHLEIIKLLDIKYGIVVLTKIDLVKDDWISLVEEEIKEKLKKSFLENAPVIRASAPKNIGISELQTEIAKLIERIQPKKDLGKPRIYIDRVFTMPGRGTVVTGTLIDGSLSLDEEIKILPQGISARIRDIQTHKKKRGKVDPGTRVALNLAGLEKSQIKRGDVVTKPDQGMTTFAVDAKVDLVFPLNFPLKHNAQVLSILETTELPGKAIILDKDLLKAGESGLVQFKFKEPLVARIGDHFILRLPSPPTTIGGGMVLDIYPKKHKRKDDESLSYLSLRKSLKLSDLIVSEVMKNEFMDQKGLLKESNFSEKEIESELRDLELSGKVLVREGMVMGGKRWEDLLGEIEKSLKEEHKKFPFKLGILKADLQSRIKSNEKLLNLAVVSLLSENKIVQKGSYLSLIGHEPKLQGQQEEIGKNILQKFAKAPLTPPIKDEILSLGKEYGEVLAFLIQQEKVIELGSGILFKKEDFEMIGKKVVDFIRKNGPSTVSQIKEQLNLSRKYAVPILEKLDQLNITKRVEDKRVLAK
jgi:selenocysteine-specific elongation factor